MGPKRDLAVIIAATAWVLLIAEHGQDIASDVPSRTEAALAATCPANDNAPYDANCIAYISGRSWQSDRTQVPPRPTPAAAVQPDTGGPDCPLDDNVPYSVRCIAFMSGWFWRPE